MGHLVSPVSYRLYNSRYWNNLWYTSFNSNFSFINIMDYSISMFVKFLVINLLKPKPPIRLKSKQNLRLGIKKGMHMKSKTEYKYSGILYNNLRIFRNYNVVYTYLYIHDSLLDLNFHEWKQNFIINEKFKGFMKKDFFLPYKKKSKRYFNYLFLLFIKRKILYPFWYYVKGIISWFLNKYFLSGLVNFSYIIGISKNNVNSLIICEYFYTRLRQYYTIFEIIRSVNFLLKGLISKKLLNGYKIIISGRFTRKQRATYSSKSFGTLSVSSMKSKLDYSYTSLALKYSNCSIKVWLNLGRKLKKGVVFVI